MRLSHFRFSAADWASMAEQWETNISWNGSVDGRVKGDFKAAVVPVGQRRDDVDKARPPGPTYGAKTDFQRLLCRHRDHFKGMVFMSEGADATVAWRLLFAFQSPMRAFFSACTRVDRPIEGAVALQRMGLIARAEALAFQRVHEFRWHPGLFLTDRSLPVGDLDKVWCFEDITYVGNDRVGTNLAPVPHPLLRREALPSHATCLI